MTYKPSEFINVQSSVIHFVFSSGSPMNFLPVVTSTVDAEDKIVVTINCLSEASPKAVVSWTEGRDALATGAVNQISNDTTQLQIRQYNVSNFLLHNYTCICYNPLGSQRREIQLQGRLFLLGEFLNYC